MGGLQWTSLAAVFAQQTLFSSLACAIVAGRLGGGGADGDRGDGTVTEGFVETPPEAFCHPAITPSQGPRDQVGALSEYFIPSK